MTALAVATESPAETFDRIRDRLAIEIQVGDIRGMVACRAAIHALRDYLADDVRLDADEVMRRAERAIGVAIRRGQADGTIRTPGRPRGGTAILPCASDFMHRNDLYAPGNGRTAGIYQLTDGVTDEAFEAALAESRVAGNLSRIAVWRVIAGTTPGMQPETEIPDPGDRSFAAIGQRLKVLRQMAASGNTSRQISERLGRSAEYIRELARREGIAISGDEVTGKGRSHDSQRIVEETVAALEGLAMGVRAATLSDLDPAEIKNWVTSLTRALPVLTRLKRDLIKEITQ